MTRFIAAGLRVVDRGFSWVVVAMMCALVVVVSLQFVDRYFVDTGIAAPDQYARVALVWLTFIGFALAVRSAANVRVDLIDAHLPPKLQAFLAGIFDAMMIVLLVAMLPGGWRLIEIGKDQDLLGTVFTAAVPAAGLFIASGLMLGYLSLRLLARITGQKLPDLEEL
jgi:TRAP-type transport system small permease protein